MGPKKRRQAAGAASSSRKRPKGLLGVASGYNSASDDDYQPEQPPKKAKQNTPARGKAGAANQKKKAKRQQAATPDTSVATSSSDVPSDSDADSQCSYNSDSSDSNETLAVRQQRKARNASQQSPAQPTAAATRRGNARGKAASTAGSRRPRAAAAAAAAAVITSWDQLPTAVLAQIFQAVCRHGALPMAPRLACVCSSFHTVVAATPELWRLLDTAAIPGRSWVQQPPTSPRSPSGKGGKGAKAAGKRGAATQKQKGKAAAAAAAARRPQQLTAEEGLRHWVQSGQLRELRSLLLFGEMGGAAGAGVQDEQDGPAAAAAAGGGDGNRQLSAGLLGQIADSCQQLRRATLFGCWSLRPEELSSVLLSMPSLSELCLCNVRFSSLTGLSTCLCSVLEAAASGHPPLKKLVMDDCLSLSQKAVNALRGVAAAAAAAGDGGDAEPGEPQPNEQQQAQLAGPGSPGAAAAALPAPTAAFPHLEVLDLSQSCGLMGRPVKVHLDDLQAAMPNLRVLKLSGLGRFYGWQAAGRGGLPLGPGFPALESLHLDAYLSASLNDHTGLRAGSSYVTNPVLLQLAGRSTRLRVLDLSGCMVTPDGLRQLAAAHAALRQAQAGAATAAAAASPLQQRLGLAADGGGGGGKGGAADAGSSGAAGASAAAGRAVAEGALRVRDLQLDNSSLACDAGLRAVGQCCCETLEQLVVRNARARLGDQGLRGLKGCSRLAALDLTGSSVTEDGLRELLSALPPGVLEELHLESCRSISRGARQAAARGVRHLQQYLADNA